MLFGKYFNAQKELWRYAVKQLIYVAASGIAVGVTVFLCRFITVDTMRRLFSVFFVCLVVPNLIYFLLFFRTEEFRDMKVLIKKVLESRSNGKE